MKKEYIIILAIFFIFVGPGPVVFFLNKYTVSILPLGSCIAFLILLRKEIQSTDLNTLCRNKEMYTSAFNGLKYCIFAHAANAIIIGNSQIITDDLIQNYLVMPFYVVVVAPIVEEIVYRKIIFGYFNNKNLFWVGSIVSSSIFAIGHFSLSNISAYFITGLILCYIYKKSGTIVTAMLIHSALNYISILVRTLKG
ncbi:CPBP family intramembrane glutamic endopeptidase [Paenibacillus periandrae]|uniref:CPBP family intramembrane glutamic endopeptidase n=1 Tax=Paenibacillus periandrae TaxID=1761741 RepID=UPI001F092E94|nr:CPBP family intramembrane glutamic endopeptidase [Paenibacillus periandrae]